MKIATPRRRALMSMLAGAIALTGFASLAAEPTARNETIELTDFMFSPAALTVPVGTTVSWKNLDEEPHTVISVDGLFRSGALDKDEAFRFTFSSAGTFRYVCSIHPKMVGTIVVNPVVDKVVKSP